MNECGEYKVCYEITLSLYIYFSFFLLLLFLYKDFMCVVFCCFLLFLLIELIYTKNTLFF